MGGGGKAPGGRRGVGYGQEVVGHLGLSKPSEGKSVCLVVFP